MKVIIITYQSGVQECIPYTLDAIDWLQAVVSDVEDLQVFEVQKIVYEETQNSFLNVNYQLNKLK